MTDFKELCVTQAHTEGDKNWIASAATVEVDNDGTFIHIETDEYEGHAMMTLPTAKLVYAALGRAIEYADNALRRESLKYGQRQQLEWKGPIAPVLDGPKVQTTRAVEYRLMLKATTAPGDRPAFIPSHDCIDRDASVMYRAGFRYPLEKTDTFNLFAISPNGTTPPEGVVEAETI